MKIGQLVAICHDGKWGRRVQGVVIATRRGHHIKVQFPHPVDDRTPVEFWVRKEPSVRHQRTKRRPGWNNHSVDLKNYRSYSGWADIDYFCPWYRVYKWPKGE